MATATSAHRDQLTRYPWELIWFNPDLDDLVTAWSPPPTLTAPYVSATSHQA